MSLEKANHEQSNINESPIGRIVDERYRLEEKLGSGGMGEVYRARDLRDSTDVAIKILKQPYTCDEKAEEYFWQEAQATALIRHPNVVDAIDIGITDETCPYIVMELLEGQTLREVIAKDAPLDVTRAMVLMLQIAEGVGAAHDVGIVHRDLKPTNVFITRATNSPSKVKVLDFSLAKLVRQNNDPDMFGFTSGKIRGTPRYMSPEQCDGKELTPASDVYSLGVILFEMLTNVLPFGGTSAKEIGMSQMAEHPPSMRELMPGIPVEIDEFVQRVLSRDPEKRPHDASEFRHELKVVAERLNLLRVGELFNLPLEKLYEVGRASPSGSLVIDAETLRQLQAKQFTKEEK
jgi:eukaryotic-like serine/threonine-protein kinase